MLLGGLQQVAKLVADGVGLAECQRLGHLEHQPPLGVGGVDPDRLLQDEVGLGVLLLTGGGGEAGFRQRPSQLVGMTVAADDEAHLADQGDLGLVVIQALAEVLGQLLEDGQVHVDTGDAGKLAGFQNGHRQAGHQHLVAWAYLVEVGLHQTGAQGVAAAQVPFAVADAKLVDRGVVFGGTGGGIHRLLADLATLVAGEINLQAALADDGVGGAGLPAGILAVVPVGFKLGIDGADAARLLQSAVEQRLDLGAAQQPVRLCYAALQLGRHAQRHLIGLLQQVGDLHRIAFGLELQGTGDFLLQRLAGLADDVAAQGVQGGGLHQGHGETAGEKQPHGEQ